MLCSRVALLQGKEKVQIYISHSRCKHKKSCEDKITGGPLSKCCISPSYYPHKNKKFLSPHARNQTEKTWRYRRRTGEKKLIWGCIFLISLSLVYGGQQELGVKSDSERNNLREKQQLGRYTLCDFSAMQNLPPHSGYNFCRGKIVRKKTEGQ